MERRYRASARVVAAVVGAVLAAAPTTVAAGAAAQATVRTGGGPLLARTGPGTNHPVARRVPNGTRLNVSCQVAGQRVAGAVRTSAVWDRLAGGRYVSDAYVHWRPRRPFVRWCDGRASVNTGGGPVNIRSNTSSTWRGRVGRLSNGRHVAARCQLSGESVSGRVRTTSLWLSLGGPRFVSDAFVSWSPRRPRLTWCDQPADPAPTSQSRFIRWAAERAAASRREYRVPISVTIAQAIIESGWGRSGLTRQGNAYFGIKCFGTPGPVAVGCRPYATSECGRNGCGPTTATFRVYRSSAKSFRDHGRFLTVNSRYDRAFDFTNNPNRFAREIHKAGYATSPTYSDNLISLMRTHDLYRFDR